jgi:hypothetical protein
MELRRQKMIMRFVTAAWLLIAASFPAFASQGSGCMPTTGTISGLTFAQDVNAAIAALISSNSGASAPATDCTTAAVKGQVWLDVSVTPNLVKQYDGSSWVIVGALDASNHLWSPPVGGGSASVTAATTTDICASPSAVQNISGSTTITSFGSACVAGVRKTLIFGAATLIIPGQRDYTTSAGDVADAIYLGSGNWRLVNITRIDGSSVVNPSVPLGTSIFGDYATAPAKTLLGFGQAVSRASYPDYFAAVTRVQSGTLTTGNNTISSVGNTAGLGAGMPVEGTGVQSGTVISSVTSSTIVMSKTATANGSQSISVIIPGYGSGGDSTTVGVKDCRGKTMVGRPNMGGSDVGLLSSTYYGTNPQVIGAIGGVQSTTVAQANLPSVSFSVTTTLPTLSVPAESHGLPLGALSDGGLASIGSAGGALTGNIPVVGSGGTASGTAASGGSGTALSNVPPSSIAECVVVVLP